MLSKQKAGTYVGVFSMYVPAMKLCPVGWSDSHWAECMDYVSSCLEKQFERMNTNQTMPCASMARATFMNPAILAPLT